jgi:hypothetical protein
MGKNRLVHNSEWKAFDQQPTYPEPQSMESHFIVDGTANRNQSAVNGDNAGVSEGPVHCAAPPKDNIQPPMKGNPHPGGGW